MTQEQVDKIKELSGKIERFSCFLEKATRIGKEYYSMIFKDFMFCGIDDEIFAQKVNDLARKRLQELKEELENYDAGRNRVIV